jgi:hypothetical protein
LTRHHHFQRGSKAAGAPPHGLIKPNQYIVATTAIPASSPEIDTVLTSDVIENIRNRQKMTTALKRMSMLQKQKLPRSPDIQKTLERYEYDNHLVYNVNIDHVLDNHPLKIQLSARFTIL